MSDCKHEPIEVAYPMRGPNGERYMQPLLFSEVQPPLPPAGALKYYNDDLKNALYQATRYALMGCRHCKAPFIDVVPPIRVVDTNTDPFRSEGG